MVEPGVMGVVVSRGDVLGRRDDQVCLRFDVVEASCRGPLLAAFDLAKLHVAVIWVHPTIGRRV